jgi:uncharacterized protein (DUF302 family)
MAADYVIARTVTGGVPETIEKVKALLAKEGFGVLSEIDVKQKLEEKIGVDIRSYVILGACHPPSAHEALKADPSIGVFMPCNVVVHATEGGTAVKAVRPTVSMGIAGLEQLRPVGERVEAALRRVVEGV